MTTQFKAEVFQNQYLPQGTQEVHAIMTVAALAGEGVTATATGSYAISLAQWGVRRFMQQRER